MSFFEENYRRLNKKQKEAVDTIDGPVLVIAGPGTGKTQLLSLRVANILKKTDALEENILCLTFTDSAVNEMKDRLNKAIGPSARKITVNTYHGFGTSLITDYPEYFGYASNSQAANNLLTNKILGEVTKKLDNRNPFRNTIMLNDIKSLLSDFKQAALYPKDIKAIVESNLSFIEKAGKSTKRLSKELGNIKKKSLPAFAQLLTNPVSPGKDTGFETLEEIWNRELDEALTQAEADNSTKPVTAWKKLFLTKDDNDNSIPAGQEQNERLLLFLPIYEEYLKRMEELERFDFADMILKSIAALKKYPEFKYSLQEQYQYILLDEYQDTNEAQAELIYLLADNPVNEGRPNIMAVGDDDQAIYSFQGGSHSHMLNFYEKYKGVKLITPDMNYRSNQEIIELSGFVADQIESRLTRQINDINKKFTSATKDKGHIRSLSFLDMPSEYSWIADNIKKTVKNGEYSKIAILSTRHAHLTSLAAYLQEKGIPINYERREDVLDDPLIHQIITICRLIVSINQNDKAYTNELLSRVLNYSFWEVDPLRVWQLSWKADAEKKDWLSLMLKDNYFKEIALFIIRLANSSLDQRYDGVLDEIVGLNAPPTKSFKSPFYEYYNSDVRLTMKTFTSLLIIRDEFTDYSEDNKGPLLIGDLIAFIDNYKLSTDRIVNSSPYIEAEESVHLMTAFSAKGQEFDDIYIFFANDNVWGSSTRSGHSFIGLPPNLKYIRQRSLDNDDEKLRLLYVAMTRARNNLYISRYQKSNSSKATLPLSYLLGSPVEEVELKAPRELPVSNIVSYYSNEYRPLIEKADLKHTLQKKLEDYQLNASDLNRFLNVKSEGPDSFFNKVFLKYPEADTISLIYGNAMHKALEYLQKYLIENHKLPSLAQLQKQFISQLKKRHLSNNDFDNLAQKGSNSLELYYKENKAVLSDKDLSEVSFKNEGVVIGGASLNGNLDKLVLDKKSKSLVIVDYKTGTPHSSWNKTVSHQLNINQLYFYKLLTENSKTYKNFIAVSGTLEYTEADAKNKLQKLSLNFEVQQTERIKKLIAAVWKHVSQLNFPDISGYPKDLKGIQAFEDDLINHKI